MCNLWNLLQCVDEPGFVAVLWLLWIIVDLFKTSRNLSFVVKLAVSLLLTHLNLWILFLLCSSTHTHKHTSSLAKRGIAGLLPICHPNLIPGFFWGQTSLAEYIIQHLRPTLQLDTSQLHGHSCSQLQCVCVYLQQECRARKNFSSLYAIVSALQSNPIHRLRRTWHDTDRSVLTFMNSHQSSSFIIMSDWLP